MNDQNPESSNNVTSSDAVLKLIRSKAAAVELAGKLGLNYDVTIEEEEAFQMLTDTQETK